MIFIILLLFIVLCIFSINTVSNNDKVESEYKAKINKFSGGSDIIDVKVISRRTATIGQYTQTVYFVTFANIKNGERAEFEFYGEDFALLTDGDRGKLTYKDNKLSFERDSEEHTEIENVEVNNKVATTRTEKEEYVRKNIETEIVDVKVVGKRLEFEGVNGGYTEYFVTFEDISSSERKEIKLSGEEYGMIAEGDNGKLVYNGEKVSFEREIHKSKKIDLVKR